MGSQFLSQLSWFYNRLKGYCLSFNTLIEALINNSCLSGHSGSDQRFVGREMGAIMVVKEPGGGSYGGIRRPT